LGAEDAYSYISIANSWANGISKDILTQATYHGHVCTGLISGQAMIQTLLKYYPPREESGLPLENTAYYVLGVPGDSDDDAFTWTMDITPGKRAYIGVDTMVDKSMTGFIRWNSATNTGLIIVMSYNETKIKQTFKAQTGLNPDASATNDLKYQKWLIDKFGEKLEGIIMGFTIFISIGLSLIDFSNWVICN
jgi:formylmethanofuran dehydrogenase subunit E-like metal-binding protein